MAGMSLLSMDNAVFAGFASYTSICLLKLLALGMLTSYRRIALQAFANPEDCKAFGGDKPKENDAVDRARRNHQNDIENIIPFVLIGLLYVTTNPGVTSALLHFRVFTMARFAHTAIYQIPLPQPSRALAHFVGLGVMISMATQVIVSAM